MKLIEDFKFVAKVKLLELGRAFRQAREVASCWKDGYPASVQEIFNPLSGMTCNMIRAAAADLIRSYPHIPQKTILQTLASPSKALHGDSPYTACLKDPKVATLDRAKLALRGPIYGLNDEFGNGLNTHFIPH